jgi:hypothetical protein
MTLFAKCESRKDSTVKPVVNGYSKGIYLTKGIG